MRNQARIRNPKSRIPDGFTLVELMVVMVIISIIVGFIINASMEARRRAEERATQSLITKLETGLNDRIEALLLTRPDYDLAHLAMSNIYNSSVYGQSTLPNNGAILGPTRAEVIAWYDYIKSELPDVFFVQNATGPYPINFAANPFPGQPLGGSTGYSQLDAVAGYVLPTGNAILGPQSGNPYIPQGTGIFGASYPAAAGLYKNLGYLPQGYDMIDNNGNGLIDEWAEGVTTTNQAQVVANLTNHTHNTARSEMLYAILVEGRGPLGAIYNPDDFTDREVQDTDDDGLPEFVDAWGQPLQFFRWPLLYHSDIQRGQTIIANSENAWTMAPPYLTAFQEREQNPLDQNQQLMLPAWWSSSYNNAFNTAVFAFPGTASQAGGSGGVQAFEYFFHRLTEPYPTPGGTTFWDRGTAYGGRRAYYSKFLIVSSGLNQQFGVFLYSDAAMKAFGSSAAFALIANENNAMPFSINDVADFTQHASIQSTTVGYNPGTDPTNPTSYDLLQAAQDDISNQNLQTTVAIGGSG